MVAKFSHKGYYLKMAHLDTFDNIIASKDKIKKRWRVWQEQKGGSDIYGS
jgi:hypothetical protein